LLLRLIAGVRHPAHFRLFKFAGTFIRAGGGIQAAHVQGLDARPWNLAAPRRHLEARCTAAMADKDYRLP
jgi:hypothetical protein